MFRSQIAGTYDKVFLKHHNIKKGMNVKRLKPSKYLQLPHSCAHCSLQQLYIIQSNRPIVCHSLTDQG